MEPKAPHMSCQKGMATSVVDLFSIFPGANALLAASEHLEDEVRDVRKSGEKIHQFDEHDFWNLG